MAQENAYGSIFVDRIRVAKLTTAGAPSAGASNGYASDAQIQLNWSTVIEAGDEGVQKNGAGTICSTFKNPDSVKRVDLSMDLCKLDSQLLALLTQGDTFEDAADSFKVIGGQLPLSTTELNIPLCLEVWTRAWDGSQQAVPTFTTPDGAYWHWVFPLCHFVPGATTLDGAIHVFPVTGTSEENVNITANGPFNDWPAEVAGEGGVTASAGWFLDSVLPTAAGIIAVPSGS